MSIKIDQLFVKEFVDGAFGLPIAHENFDYKPTGRTAYAELIQLPNPIVGLSLATTDETSGLFRVILRYPIGKSSGPAKVKAEAIMAAFPVNSKITYSSQAVTILGTGRQPGVHEDGWYKIVVTIRYSALITR